MHKQQSSQPEKIKKKNELFDHQEEIEKELNNQLKLYKEKQRQEMYGDNSYESFLNKNNHYKEFSLNDEQTLNDYYYNMDSNNYY